MIKKIICYIVISALLSASVPIVTYAQENDSPRVEDVRGAAFVYRVGGHSYSAVYRGMNIYDGDVIVTGINSTVTVMYYGQMIIMGELTRLSFNSVWQRHGRRDSSITLVEGMIKVRVDVQLDDNSRNMVQAAGTIVGVRGTKYILTYRRLLFGEEAVGTGNPFVRMLVIDGEIAVDLPDPNNLGDVATFLVTPAGMVRLTEDVYGRQVQGEKEALSEDFVIPLASLDLGILEAIRNDPSAMALNPELFRYIDEAIEVRREEDELRMALLEERPPPQIISASEATEILANLQRPSEIEPPPVHPDELQEPDTQEPLTTEPGETVAGQDSASPPPDVPSDTPEQPTIAPDGPTEPPTTPPDTPVDLEAEPPAEPMTPPELPTDPPTTAPVDPVDPPVTTPTDPPVDPPVTQPVDPVDPIDPGEPGDSGDPGDPIDPGDLPPPPPPPTQITMAISPNNTPLTAANSSLTFDVMVSGLINEQTSASIRPTIGAISGLSFAGHNAPGVWNATTQTRTFTITVTYDGQTDFPSGSAELAINLAGLGSTYVLTGGGQSKTVNINDSLIHATAAVVPAEQVLSPLDRTLTFEVVVSGFSDEASSAALRPTIDAVTGLTFSGQTSEGVWNNLTQTRTFTITVTYNGTTEFPKAMQTLDLGLIGYGSNDVCDEPLTLDIDILDGHAPGARAIPVTQENIQRPDNGFNALLNSTPILRQRHFVLQEDVALLEQWMQIPATNVTAANPGFAGSFEGAGHIISGLYSHAPTGVAAAGMFAEIAPGGVVRNLGLVNATLSNFGGGSAGLRMGGIAGANRGTIENSFVSYGDFVTTGLTAARFLGGIAGRNYGTINNTFARVDLSSANSDGNVAAGGIAGHNSGTIQNSVALNDSLSSGGVFGRITSNNTGGAFSNNFARADMILNGATQGMGDNQRGIDITDSNVYTVQAMLDMAHAHNAPNLLGMVGLHEQFEMMLLLPEGPCAILGEGECECEDDEYDDEYDDEECCEDEDCDCDEYCDDDYEYGYGDCEYDDCGCKYMDNGYGNGDDDFCYDDLYNDDDSYYNDDSHYGDDSYNNDESHYNDGDESDMNDEYISNPPDHDDKEEPSSDYESGNVDNEPAEEYAITKDTRERENGEDGEYGEDGEDE